MLENVQNSKWVRKSTYKHNTVGKKIFNEAFNVTHVSEVLREKQKFKSLFPLFTFYFLKFLIGLVIWPQFIFSDSQQLDFLILSQSFALTVQTMLNSVSSFL